MGETVMQAIHNLIVMVWLSVFISWIATIAMLSAKHNQENGEE